MRKNNSYIPNPQTLVHVDEVLKLLSVFGEDKRFAETINNKNREESEVRNMCEWLDIVEEKCREEGEIKGEIKGRILALLEFGKTPEECIADIIKKYHLTEDEAREYVDKYTLVHS